MSRKRMIDPGIWNSEQVASLSVRQRLLFIGLISNADDEGKLKGSAAYIKSIIFPYDSIPLTTIETDLNRLSKSIIVRYRIDELWYIKLPTWHKHQYIREPKPSDIPDPMGSTPPYTPPPTLKQQQTKGIELEQKGTELKPVQSVFSKTLELLLSCGIPKLKAMTIFTTYPANRIEEVVNYALRVGKNPAGMVLKALQSNWTIPMIPAGGLTGKPEAKSEQGQSPPLVASR